ncbi:hypothetical protein ACJRO7_009824 [Eucalyptus globulus]|uniref:Uncharacterized protein n=1 Tax=Eucalyptus globulus TaxID=34317 RepID=A0ABD3LDJ2_EUCGL
MITVWLNRKTCMFTKAIGMDHHVRKVSVLGQVVSGETRLGSKPGIALNVRGRFTASAQLEKIRTRGRQLFWPADLDDFLSGHFQHQHSLLLMFDHDQGSP